MTDDPAVLAILKRIREEAFAYELRALQIICAWRPRDNGSPIVQRAPPPPEMQRPRDLTGIGGHAVDSYIAQLPALSQRRPPNYDRLSAEAVADIAARTKKTKPELTARPTHPAKRRGAE